MESVISLASIRRLTRTPVLEECYRIKREISEEFQSIDELYEHLAEESEKHRKAGRKYLPLPPHLTEYRPRKKEESD